MNIMKTMAALVLAATLALGLAACREEGPAEKAGKKMDETMEKASEKMNDLLGK
ncbi:MAG: hypothetical protein JSU88_06855 [Nitrospinaceae bacterium]|nr:MAG: hypothetical protein JSU88_06855 [Nitrospinaceae bacterium]